MPVLSKLYVEVKYLITGLGNIGVEYSGTRHNIGFDIVDHLAEKFDLEFSSARYAFKTSFRYKSRTFVLIKPTTFMNLSGKAVSYWLKKENLPIDRLLVVTDDIALELGKLRMRKKGSDGGHNGLANIIQLLGMTKFNRLRFGIGGEFLRGYQVDYVLGKWSKEEKEIIEPKITKAMEMILAFGTIGVDRTMNQYNNT